MVVRIVRIHPPSCHWLELRRLPRLFRLPDDRSPGIANRFAAPAPAPSFLFFALANASVYTITTQRPDMLDPGGHPRTFLIAVQCNHHPRLSEVMTDDDSQPL